MVNTGRVPVFSTFAARGRIEYNRMADDCAAAESGRVRCKGRLRTGSGPKGSSPKWTRPCAVVCPVAFRGGVLNSLNHEGTKTRSKIRNLKSEIRKNAEMRIKKTK